MIPSVRRRQRAQQKRLRETIENHQARKKSQNGCNKVNDKRNLAVRLAINVAAEHESTSPRRQTCTHAFSFFKCAYVCIHQRRDGRKTDGGKR